MKARDKNLRLAAIIKCCLSGSKKYTEGRKKERRGGEEGSGRKERSERERSSRREEGYDLSSETEPCPLTDDQSQQ